VDTTADQYRSAPVIDRDTDALPISPPELSDVRSTVIDD